MAEHLVLNIVSLATLPVSIGGLIYLWKKTSTRS